MKAWTEYSYEDKMTLIANALGIRYWSVSDSIDEDARDLLDKLRERGLQAAYVQHLAALSGIDAPHLSPDQIFELIMTDPDRCYHAAARALGVEV